jgi:uncharacterized protein YprB with RNaseH-like and TPR domain
MIKNKKRLFFDIETSPNIGFFWSSGYKLNIPHNNIIKERAIICVCYKWEDEEKVYSLTWDKNQDDKSLLIRFIEIANEADELIGHNGDKYDTPWIRTRCLFHGIPCFPSYNTIDTLKHARSSFKFNSNKLDYIANFLGVGGKTETGFDLWKNIVLHKDSESLNKMVEYCKNDVIILEKVYSHMVNYIPHKTHYGIINGQSKYSCPECSSLNLSLSKKRYSASGALKIQLQCNNCYKYHTISNKEYEKKLVKDNI